MAASSSVKPKGQTIHARMDAATRARRDWIMAEIRKGSVVGRDAVAARFKISPTTAKHDFAVLVEALF